MMNKYAGLKTDLWGIDAMAAVDASDIKNRQETSNTRRHLVTTRIFSLGVLLAALGGIFWTPGVAAAPMLSWATVANNCTNAPDLVSGEKSFSDNQPSIN